jgi:hypothetical protein
VISKTKLNQIVAEYRSEQAGGSIEIGDPARLARTPWAEVDW